MGKTRIKRRSSKVNPVGIPSIKDCEEDEPNSPSDTGDVAGIIARLQSSNIDKECAAYNIANMADNPSFVVSMIKEKLIRIAGPLLLDRSLAVRHAIAGSLRNLAVCGDYSVCQAMIDQDIMTSIVALLSEYKDPWTPHKSSKDNVDSKLGIFVEVCNLLWSLCESSDTAVAIFNEKELIKILLPCLNVSVYGLQIPVAVAQCLHTVGEENAEAIEELSRPLVQEQLKVLMTIDPKKPEHILLKTLAAGIIMLTVSSKNQNSMSDVTKSVVKVIADTLSELIKPALSHLSDNITSHKNVRRNKYRDEHDLKDKLEMLSNTSNTLDYILQAKQISLEILTNIFVGDGEWDDISTSDDSEEMDIDETSVVAPLKLGLEVPPEIHLMVMQHELLKKVTDQIVTPTENIRKVILEYPKGSSILKRLNTVRTRALLCLNNMIQSLTVDNLGGPAHLFDLWMNITNLLLRETDSTNTDQLEAATGSMRDILQKLAEVKYSAKFSSLSESDLQFLINICHQSQEAAVKVNVIRSLGIIGCLIGDPELLQSSCKLFTDIAVFLLEISSRSSDLWVTAEALDVIIDMFAEDHVDYIAQAISLVEKLDNLHKVLKGRIKQQRKFLGDHLPVIKTTKENLLRFIQYKNQRKK